jgi:transcriptional regulator with XRE-family HTH domain
MNFRTGMSIVTNSDKPLDVYLGRAISITRCSLAMTVEDLSTKSEIVQSRLLQVERGDAPVTLAELFRIATALDSNPSTVSAVAEKLRVKWQPE